MAVSQVSPVSTMPLPQTVPQSGSLVLLHPAGQQPSACALHCVIAVLLQLCEQTPPVSESAVHALPSSQP
jgi:hypothetical protein